MVLNKDFEYDDDTNKEWELIPEDGRQEEQQSLLDDDQNSTFAKQTRSNIADEAGQQSLFNDDPDSTFAKQTRSNIAEDAEKEIIETTNEEQSKETHDSSARNDDEKNRITVEETRNIDEEETTRSITTPLIAKASTTPQNVDNVNEKDSNTENIQHDQTVLTANNDDVKNEQKEETKPLEENKDNKPSPKLFPFFQSAARRLADTIIDIDKKHQVREKAQSSLKSAETSAQNVCQTIGGAVMDIDKKHQVREKTRNSFIGKSVKTIGKKLGGAVIDVDKKHQVLKKTENSLKAAGTSARDVGMKIGSEVKGSTRAIGEGIGTKTSAVKERIRQVYNEKNIEEKVRTTAGKIKTTTKKAGEKAKQFNEEYHVTEVIGAAAVVGAGLLLAKGNVKLGATAAAAGGAAYMAGEAMKAPYRHDSGLNEHMHME